MSGIRIPCPPRCALAHEVSFAGMIARRWSPERIVATTTSDNARMLSLFEERGFVRDHEEDGVVRCEKPMRHDTPTMM